MSRKTNQATFMGRVNWETIFSEEHRILPKPGYRPQIIFAELEELNGVNVLWDIVLEDISPTDEEPLNSIVRFRFGSPQAPDHLISPGLTFVIKEARLILANGTVLERVRPDAMKES